jgi:hypothetical protein
MSLWRALKRTAGFFVDCLCSQRLYRRMDDEEFPCKQELVRSGEMTEPKTSYLDY